MIFLTGLDSPDLRARERLRLAAYLSKSRASMSYSRPLLSR
jgi:hypothetical protein